ncbi:MAG: winged helix-turn-helix domain-containing protein [Thermoproteota archaeon]|nr:winged helix-turn-helix domain-containing protein [Thermoproteota archaeon]
MKKVFPLSRRTLQRWWKSLKTKSNTKIIGLISQAGEREALIRSKIMYQAILNFKHVTDYTAILIQESLLTYLMLDRKYAITDKGRQFLALFNETSKLLTAPDDDDDNMAAGNLQVQNQQQEVRVHK